MSGDRALSDAAWERIPPLMPSSAGMKSRPFRDHRRVVEGVIHRFRTGILVRDRIDSDEKGRAAATTPRTESCVPFAA